MRVVAEEVVGLDATLAVVKVSVRRHAGCLVHRSLRLRKNAGPSPVMNEARGFIGTAVSTQHRDREPTDCQTEVQTTLSSSVHEGA